MPAWEELRRHLTARWPVTTRDPSWCGIVLDGQRVAVKPAAPDVVIVVAQVCPLSALPPEQALRYNGWSAHGMLMLEERTYVLRQVVPLAHLGAGELDDLIAAMAAEAERLRRQVAVAPAPAEAARVFAFMVH